MPLSYQSYLRLEELLALQTPVSQGPEHDELLFITIHQVYELWFKQMLHEMALIQRGLESNDQPVVLHGFKRVLSILKTLVAQIDILETMTPVSFNSFRHRLESASGFQSVQFRALEFTLGQRSVKALARYTSDQKGHAWLESIMHRRSLWDSFLLFLKLNHCPVEEALLTRDLTQPPAPSAPLQATLVAIYRDRSTLMQVCERLVDLDEGLQEWRYRHVKMVERTIGTKQGTGGSSGADYLRSTLFKPLFPDLWAIRSAL